MKKNYIEKRREGGKEFSDDNRFKKKRNDSCLGEETVSWEKCVMTQVVSVANLRCRLPVVSIPQRLNRETKRRRVRQLRNDQFVFFFRLVAGADNQPDSILLTDGKILFIIHLVECRSGIPNNHRGRKAWELFSLSHSSNNHPRCLSWCPRCSFCVQVCMCHREKESTLRVIINYISQMLFAQW